MNAVVLAATRSSAWVWVVVAGLAISAVLAYHVISSAIATFPTDIQAALRKSVRSNGRPLAVTAVILTWTIAYALYSVAVIPETPDPGTAVSAIEQAEEGDTGSAVLTPETSSDDAGGAAPGSPTVPAVGSGGGGAAGGGNAAPAPSQPVTGATAPATVRDADLYSGAANTTGITGDLVKVCGHAPLSLGAVLNTKPEDLLVFWRWLNDRGGIHGRQFEISLEDDQYTAEGGVPAAQACAERNPFLIFGALGSDVIPPVRQWAEENKQLYLYGFTLREGSENLRYSFTGTISQEDLSRVVANIAVDRLAGKKIGIVWRDSTNFQPGRDAFKKTVEAKGAKVVADIPVQKSQGTYTQEIIALQQAGAEVVFMLDDAFSQTNIVKQSKSQQYHPRWVVFSFNIQTQTLGDDALEPPLMGANLAPAYECHTYDGPYAEYAEEIKVFEAAYAEYSPNTDLCGIAGDVAWQGWVGFKAIAGFFEACGRDCTRNRFAGVMESGFKAKIGAACPVDFSGDGHHGGFDADVMEAYAGPNGRPAWRNVERCASAG